VRSASLARKNEHLRKVLADARREVGLTQVALAKKLGRPQSFVSKFERGERRLDVVEFVELATALQLDPAAVVRELQRR
jgi:transcriptional regulator with XRE-family HTH domain